MKFDSEKVQMGLLPYAALRQVAWVMMFGAEKYEPNNWKTIEGGAPRYLEAAQRHMGEIFDRLNEGDKLYEILDEESGMPSLAHAACDLLFALWFIAGDVPEKWDLSGVRERFAKLREEYTCGMDNSFSNMQRAGGIVTGCDGPIDKKELPR